MIADAQLAVLEFAVEQLYVSPLMLEPRLPSWLASQWAIRRYVTGQDTILRKEQALALGGRRVFYGALLESLLRPGEFIVFLRGTDGLIEWLIDAECALIPHAGGKVEAGFDGLYGSLMSNAPGGSDEPLLASLQAAVGEQPLTVVGHSLGAALATELAYDLAPHIPTNACLIASPRPGDQGFSASIKTRVPEHRAYAYILDAVAHLPAGFGYCPVPNLTLYTPSSIQVRIGLSLDCFHHSICVAAMMDPDAVDLSTVPYAYSKCITKLAKAA